MPNLWRVLHAAPRSSVLFAVLWGAVWGIGGLTFGLAIRYLGIALGYAIALGLCTAFGTLIPPIYDGSIRAILTETSGRVILSGVLLCQVAVAVNGMAGFSKEREVTPEDKAQAGESDFAFGKGIAVAVFAGVMSSFFAFGLRAGAPIAQIAKSELIARHRLDLWQNLPVLIVVLWGGFATNFIWSAILIAKNRSARQFLGATGKNPMHAEQPEEQTRSTYRNLTPSTLTTNYVLAALAGIIWCFQFFFYSMGQTKMGKYDFSSWTLHMASIIIFATVWGLALREWRGTSRRTGWLVAAGLFLLVSSTVVVGYGNYLKAGHPETRRSFAAKPGARSPTPQLLSPVKG